MSKREHETVGRLFRAHDGIYRCTRYVRASGFDMQCLERGMHDSMDVPPRLTNVSEAAIGRTFHLIHDKSYEKHTQPCNCYVCEDGEPGSLAGSLGGGRENLNRMPDFSDQEISDLLAAVRRYRMWLQTDAEDNDDAITKRIKRLDQIEDKLARRAAEMEEFDCWYLDWQGRTVSFTPPSGQEPILRRTIEGSARANDAMHEALRGCYSSAVQDGKSWFFYSTQRGLVGVITPKR